MSTVYFTMWTNHDLLNITFFVKTKFGDTVVLDRLVTYRILFTTYL